MKSGQRHCAQTTDELTDGWKAKTERKKKRKPLQGKKGGEDEDRGIDDECREKTREDNEAMQKEKQREKKGGS